ncbi:maltose alpha-D-glucosyltransferase [Fodinicurvata sp. EGI_FJ10296]|uniref:maltose alpha-D-glucosyltransferase n=1 Tax=Fodinicurvata sp. EGI_FJ10296 TaxID=3231908 RepID=UPI003451D9AC
MTGSAAQGQATEEDLLWYKDAIIYEVHVKSFFDANNDGIGDFQGLIEKLDYLKHLGVTALWLLPFYPSPLRDDGYDIADYRNVNPSYGTMRDFRSFVKLAHEQGLKVITELVINHTSDQHPWFQRARRASKGSKYRDWYVWSDDDRRWPETRIIFSDTETSNWTWDPVAGQYYWHRFFSHQPDLNFDNPQVMKAVISAMRFWLDTGVDGLRLDAIPYLVERDGTNNENIDETHAVLKELRKALDDSHPHAFFLAEANQWPEDTLPYFGDGDECHMGFHFPLMPRMFMAMAQEDRHPITDIMRQTPEIPESCQWAIFLRNHDELTLEMVTDRERDYLWRVYASDQRARINFGIRRRLAPLMDNDRRKIELLNSLLFSMPGTPIIYYGDEIGMGDNFFLGDRDGVRTPMQWSPDRNGGFSRADPALLYLPAIMDPIYGFQAVNVEAQNRSSSSLLHWMRRIIAVRTQHQCFGRGTMTFLYPGNRKILAYLREYGDDIVLCVANLSRQAQAVELDLAAYRTRVPVELLGRAAFPPIGDLPYLLTLPAYGFYWFVLTAEADAPSWHVETGEMPPDFHTIVMRGAAAGLLDGRPAADLTQKVLPDAVKGQRWFAQKGRRIRSMTLADGIVMSMGRDDAVSLLVDIESDAPNDPGARYFVPLAMVWEETRIAQAGTLAKVRRGAKVGIIADALGESDFVHALINAMRNGKQLAGRTGHLECRAGQTLSEMPAQPDEPVRRMGVEQSNTSLVIGDRMVLKVLRRLMPGIHPEIEIVRFLTERAGFDRVPAYLGNIDYVDASGDSMAVGLLQAFVRNQGDGWHFTQDYLTRELDELRLTQMDESGPAPVDPVERFAVYLQSATIMGRRTAELHKALASAPDEPDFAPEPFAEDDLASLKERVRTQLEKAMNALSAGGLADAAKGHAQELLNRRADLESAIDDLAAGPAAGQRIRHHGDLHLGQILLDQADFLFVDFEGEPTRPVSERRAKALPLRDVAGMVRSFDYAAWSVLLTLETEIPGSFDRLAELVRQWRALTREAYITAYFVTMGDNACLPEDRSAAERLLELFVMEKALYEVVYEAENRPTWLRIPVQGLLSLLDRRSSE